MENEKKDELEINPADVQIDGYSSVHQSGFSLQPLNGVKITHLPTGITVTCENERSQYRNKAIAVAELKEKLRNYKAPQNCPSPRGKKLKGIERA